MTSKVEFSLYFVSFIQLPMAIAAIAKVNAACTSPLVLGLFQPVDAYNPSPGLSDATCKHQRRAGPLSGQALDICSGESHFVCAL